MGFFDFLRGKPKVPKEALIPWVHRATHLDLIRFALTEQAEGKAPAWEVRKLNDAFAVTLAAASSNGPLPVSLDDVRLSKDDAFGAALKNVAPVITKIGVGEGLVIWETSNQLAGAAVLMAGGLPLPLQKPYVMMYPHADLALMTSAGDEKALALMLETAVNAYEQSSEYRSLHAITYDETLRGQLWLPPEEHPLRARFVEASARARRHDAQEAAQVLAKHLPCGLAPLGARRVTTGGFAAGWMRGADVLIPDTCERLVLFDTDDAPTPTLELDFKMVREAMSDLFERIPLPNLTDDEPTEEPPALFWRTRGSIFPSHRACAFLAARQAATVKQEEVPAKTLFDAWDAGVPVHFTEAPVDPKEFRVRLNHPDGRFAEVPVAELAARRKKLPAQDELSLRMLLRAQLMMNVLSKMSDAMERGEDVSDAPADSPSSPDELPADVVPDDVLVAQMQEARLTVLPSASKDDDDDGAPANAPDLPSLEGTKLFIVVRPPGYAEASRAKIHGGSQAVAAKEDVNVVIAKSLSQPFVEGCRLDVVNDAGATMVTLDEVLVPESLRAACWTTARLNLRAQSVHPFSATNVPGVFLATWGDGYELSRALLLPELALACEVKGAPLLFAPLIGKVWVTGSDDLDGQRTVLDEIDAYFASGAYASPYAYREVFFGTPWVVTAQKVAPWVVPPKHPHRARIDALDAVLAKRRETSAQHVGAFARAVTVKA